MRRIIMLLLGTGVFLQAYSFPCYITLVKDNCWTEYDVNVTVINVLNEQVLTTIHIPKGESWSRKELVCEPKQTVMFKAVFSPVFWESDSKKVYFGKRYWSFPDKIVAGAGAWDMKICFSDHFAAVPLPPEGGGHCACDMTGIPPIKPR